MDCITFLKDLILGYESGCGFFLSGSFKVVYEVLGLFLLFAFGFKSLYSDWCSRGLVRFLCDFRVKSSELTNGFPSKNVFDEKCGLNEPLTDTMDENRVKSNLDPNPDEKPNTDSDEEFDDNCDVSMLRKMIRIERNRANAAIEELEKERAASASAAEEAMAMILRLQNEKSLIDMELNQYRRLAEEKQVHDREVIRSLQWLVLKYRYECGDELKSCRRELMFKEVEEGGTCLNNEDDLDDLLFSSLDFCVSPK